uniref:Uncharacterized protein n=1 Tax=Lepeophtheirus salmonis TaxID=72036 RepID=A0A0K2UH40_LEPSM
MLILRHKFIFGGGTLRLLPRYQCVSFVKPVVVVYYAMYGCHRDIILP